MKLYLIRHAEAEGNIFRRVHGWYDSSVTPNGLRQIAALQKRFETVQVDEMCIRDRDYTIMNLRREHKLCLNQNIKMMQEKMI